LEKVTPSVLISTIYFAGVKSKTIELQREIYDKFNVEVIVFLNSKIIPLEPYSIQVIVDAATEGKIINFSLYDGIAFSKETYRKLGEPNMKDLFSAARKNRIPIQTLTVSSIVDNTKTYSLDGKDLFWQSGGEDHEKKFWDKCEEVLVRGMYEDRSIEH